MRSSSGRMLFFATKLTTPKIRHSVEQSRLLSGETGNDVYVRPLVSAVKRAKTHHAVLRAARLIVNGERTAGVVETKKSANAAPISMPGSFHLEHIGRRDLFHQRSDQVIDIAE